MLFGVVATRIGLGQMPIDIAYCVALICRWTGWVLGIVMLEAALTGYLVANLSR